MSIELINLYILSIISLIYFFFVSKKINSIKKIELSENKLSRVYFFDFIKGVSIMAVFIMHICYFYILNTNQNISSFNIYITKIFRFAVPFFIISSGFLLELKDYKKETILNFYKNRFVKILIPYLVICVFLFFFKDYKNINTFLINILDGNISVPFYFITVLIQLYILYPLIKYLINKFGSKKSLFISFFISIIFAIIFPKIFLIKFFYNTFLAYIFFFVFGITLKKYYFNPEFKNTLKNIKFIKFGTTTILLYYLLALIDIGKEYSNFQFIYAPTLFLFVYYFKDKIEKIRIYKYFCFLGRNSLYIFLIHFTVMEIIFKYLNILNINFYLEYILFIFTSFIFAILLPSVLIKYLNSPTKKE